MHPGLIIYHPSVKESIHCDFTIEVLADDCGFTEGPVWHPEGFYLFSDIPANVIYKIYPGEQKQVFITDSGTNDPSNTDLNKEQPGSNGLTYTNDGKLLVCQHGYHRIVVWEADSLRPFIEIYNGKPFNSPNDIIVHKNGSIYFSDPPYGLKGQELNTQKFQPIAGVYCYHEGEVTLICNQYKYPNGVCLSPDQDILYICSTKHFEKFISAYDTSTNEFIKVVAKENSDGIKCDRRGNLYLCNEEGLLILNNQGERLALIKLPETPANICWGGIGLNDLLITARQYVLLISNLQCPS